MSKIFTQLPEELFEHPIFKDIKKNNHAWKWGIAIILRRAAFSDQQDLKRGQVKISIRQLSEEANITKKQAEKLIRFLKGITAQNEKRVDGACILRETFGGHERVQKGGHEKQVYDVLLTGFFDIEGTLKGTSKATLKGTSRGHEGDMNPRENPTESRSLEAIKEPPSAEVVKTKDLIGDGLLKLGLTKAQADSLFRTWRAEIVFLAYQHITADGYVIETTPIQAMKFACKNEPWGWKSNKPTPESHREKFMKHFEDGKVYNGYQLQLSPSGFLFFAGRTNDGAKFDDPHFSAQMSRVLKRFGIQHPTQIDFKNIKEA